MRKLILAVALLMFGAITFSTATPARALEAGSLAGVTKAMPAGEVTKVHYRRHHRHWYRHCYRGWRCYRPCYRRCYYPRYNRCCRPCCGGCGWAWYW